MSGTGQSRFRHALLLLGLGLGGLPLRASAQSTPPAGTTPDGHGFDPAPIDREVRDPLIVHRVGGWAPRQGYFTGVFEYAADPLVWCSRATDNLGCIQEEDLLVDVYALNLSGGYAPTERLRFYANLPTFLSTESDHSDAGGGVGDLRLGGQLAAFRGEGPVQLGFVPWLDLPTGDEERYLGDPGVGGGAAIAGSLSVGMLTLSSDLGVSFTPASNVFPTGLDSLLTGLAAGFSPSDSWGLTAETRVSPSILTSPVPGTGAPAELLYSARHRRGSLHMLAGVSHALTAGPGAASWRAFAGLGWTSTSSVDLDGDGYLHEYDKCPYEAEAFNNWRDGDGCPEDPVFFHVEATQGGRPIAARAVEWDIAGALPNSDPSLFVSNPGRTLQVTASYGGCYRGSTEVLVAPGMPAVSVPLQAELGTLRLSVFDRRTEAPVPGVKLHWRPDGQDPFCHPQGVEALSDRGALIQTVGAGELAWIVEAPGMGPRVVSTGIEAGRTTKVDLPLWPARTRLAGGRILLSDPIWFHYESFAIEPDSLEVLEEVAARLLLHPELGRVQVVGHTDDQGDEAFNMALSIRRAQAAVDTLVAFGVPEEQLEIIGYGATRPIARNTSRRGRAKNRRVEFIFLDAGN